MRKLKFVLSIIAVASVAYFSSCKKDTVATPPTITFNNTIGDTVHLASGITSYTVNATLVASGKFSTASYTVASGSSSSTNPITWTNDTAVQVNIAISNITATTTVTISVTDKNSASISKSLFIKLAPVAPATEVLNFWTATMMGAQSNTTYGSAFSASTGLAYLKNDNFTSDMIDFIYYYKSTDVTVGAEMMSPKYAFDNGPVGGTDLYNTLNETMFKSVSLSTNDFDAIPKTDDSAITAAATGFVDQRVTALAVNSVFAFKTAAGKLGLVKVSALTATTSGTITIVVKVQK